MGEWWKCWSTVRKGEGDNTTMGGNGGREAKKFLEVVRGIGSIPVR